MSWRDRIVDDGASRGQWLAARDGRVGASDAKMFANLQSVEKYTLAKLRPKTFFGNETTKSGHRWEPMILAYLGVPGNTALVHAPDNERFVCTPDGIQDEGRFMLAEAKTRHGVIRPNPDAGEWRQLAWQLFCFPEAELVRFGTVTLVRDEAGEWDARNGGYSVLDVPRDHPKIVKATELIVPIATLVLAELDAFNEKLKEVPF